VSLFGERKAILGKVDHSRGGKLSAWNQHRLSPAEKMPGTAYGFWGWVQDGADKLKGIGSMLCLFEPAGCSEDRSIILMAFTGSA
jgi:hypothetical protein